MKTLMILTLGLMTPWAHAAVTDMFDCKLTITDSDGSTIQSQTNRVAMMREPLANATSPQPGSTRSEARLSLSVATPNLARTLLLDFVIVQVIDAQGQAFQNSCFGPATYLCDQPSCLKIATPEIGHCTPGAPEQYGVKVGIADGLPTISTAQMPPTEIEFGENHGKGRVECKLVGTYN